MLNDAVCFKNVYIVTGYTDLRFGIDSLAALIKSKLGEGATCSGYFIPVLWQANGSNQRIGLGIRWIFCFYTKGWNKGTFSGRDPNQKFEISPSNSFRWLMEGLTVTPKRIVKQVEPPEYMG